MNTDKMPVIFVAHGSPMNAIADNIFTQRLQAWGKELPRPRAIVVISAHWLTQDVTLSQASIKPEIIYDFGGFPQALYEVQYPAYGKPELALDVAQHISHNISSATENWGLDHGSWSVLKHLFPQADIPVFQLSIDFSKPARFHYEIGEQLQYLRKQGVLILGSGNIIHNLATVSWHSALNEVSHQWVSELDNAIKHALDTHDVNRLVDYTALPHAHTGIRNPDHYYPLLYTLGAAQGYKNLTYPYEGFELGTLSMRCIQWNG
jgi:4,5-DOPA dioxygenase extradiol